MANESFSATIDQWVKQTEQRMTDVVVTALDNMINDMQLSRDKGGRMPVDTGFLRSTGLAALNVMPTGPSEQTDAMRAVAGQYTGAFDTWNGNQLEAVLIDLKLGDTFFFGWTAVYANAQDTYTGFMSLPVQNWQDYVDDATREVRTTVER